MGEAFDLHINVDEQATEFRGFKLIFTYDDTIMDFLSAQKGGLMTGQPVGWWVIDEEISGYVKIECIIFGAGLYVSGPGTILVLNFMGLSEDITELYFEVAEFYDVLGYIIAYVTTDDGTVIIGDPVLPPPENVRFSYMQDSILLIWNSLKGANGYKIFSSLDPYTGYDSLGSTRDTLFSIQHQEESQMFFYLIGDTHLFGHE